MLIYSYDRYMRTKSYNTGHSPSLVHLILIFYEFFFSAQNLLAQTYVKIFDLLDSVEKRINHLIS